MKINAYKIRMAQKFLNILKKELKHIKTKNDLTLEMYANGREHGYHIRCLDTACQTQVWGCSFSENRNSDDFVVYLGWGFNRFSMQGNVPDDEVYGNKRIYRCDSLQDAVKDILLDLSGFLATSEKVEVVS